MEPQGQLASNIGSQRSSGRCRRLLAPHRGRREKGRFGRLKVPRRGNRSGAHCGRIVKTTGDGLLSSSPASSMLSDTFRSYALRLHEMGVS
jgi:hypothetical protein